MFDCLRMVNVNNLDDNFDNHIDNHDNNSYIVTISN
jgi:hypothetical protein